MECGTSSFGAGQYGHYEVQAEHYQRSCQEVQAPSAWDCSMYQQRTQLKEEYERFRARDTGVVAPGYAQFQEWGTPNPAPNDKPDESSLTSALAGLREAYDYYGNQ